MSSSSTSVIVKLQYPVSMGTENITQVMLSRPKGKHLKKIGASPSMEDMINIAQKVSGEAAWVFDDMDAVDVLKCAEVIGGFLASGPETGNEPSPS